jgi:ferrous iron transport protein A
MVIKMLCSIKELPAGASAVIEKIKATGELGRRLRDMGLSPGIPLILLGRAPLADPLEIKIRGFNLCLRNSEAEKIMVRVDR